MEAFSFVVSLFVLWLLFGGPLERATKRVAREEFALIESERAASQRAHLDADIAASKGRT